MSIRVNDTLDMLAKAYKDAGQFLGLATSEPSQATTNEPSGTDYSRVPANWQKAGSIPGVYTSKGIIMTADSGTYTHGILCRGSATGAADLIDYCPIGNITLSGKGQITLSVSYTQT